MIIRQTRNYHRLLVRHMYWQGLLCCYVHQLRYLQTAQEKKKLELEINGTQNTKMPATIAAGVFVIG